MLRWLPFAVGIGVVTGMAGCQQAPKEAGAASVARAVAILDPTEGNTARGRVTFVQSPAGMRVVADIEGLSPGAHGLHVHEYGDCSAPDGSSAGGHFNPDHLPHGAPDADKRHVGDLGNITADAAGRVHDERVDPRLSFRGGRSILARAVIVHEQADDFVSQPSGAAGSRVACGVIGIAGAEGG